MDYNIKGIPPMAIPALWRFAEPFVKRALDHTYGEVSSDDLKNMCLTENAQLWLISKGRRVIGASTTQIVVYPQMKVCRIITLAGAEFDEWVDVAHMNLELWAESMGCTAMEAFCRRGFVPKLEGIGYKHRYSVVHKSLRG